jgi:mannose-1-phosphate guanylyltransferase / phosphomannomutase
MKGVILAGGKGTRLHPLTYDTPKPMLRVLGKPVMEYSIELLKKHHITKIAILIHYQGEQIRSYFQDGSRWGVELVYFEDNPPLGTAGSIKAAERFLDETFVVISGDVLTDIHLRNGIHFHQQRDALLTMIVKEEENPSDFGIIKLNIDGQIIRYIEKPTSQEVFSFMVNTGIYVMQPSILKEIKPFCFTDLSKHIIPMMMQREKKVYGYVTIDYWLDIGTLPRYERATRDLLSKKMKILLPRRRENSFIMAENQMK